MRRATTITMSEVAERGDTVTGHGEVPVVRSAEDATAHAPVSVQAVSGRTPISVEAAAGEGEADAETCGLRFCYCSKNVRCTDTS